MVNYVHAEAPGIFQVQRAIVNEDATLRCALRHLQCDAVNGLFRLARIQVAGAEEKLKIVAQLEGLNAILVEFQRFIVDRSNEILPRPCQGRQDGASLRKLSGLRKHEGGEFFPGERARPVEEGAIQVLVEGDLARVKSGERKIVAVLEILPIELEGLGSFAARIAIPPVRQNDAANIKKNRADFGHRKPPAPA